METTTGVNTGKYHIKTWITYKVVENGVKKWPQRPYKTGLFATMAEWDIIQDKRIKKVSEHIKDIRSEITKLEAKANHIIDELRIYDQRTFELFFLAEHDLESVQGQYELKINKLLAVKPEPKISTAEKYTTSLKSLLEFSHPKLTFQEITPEFLQDYQGWYTSEQRTDEGVTGRAQSLTSVGINLRHLRGVFNQAINLKVISPEIYPFYSPDRPGGGDEKYVIPEGEEEVKKFLPLDQVYRFLEYKTDNEKIAYFYDFAVFILFGNGMNPADILEFRVLDDRGDYFQKERVKTQGKKKKIKRVVTPIHERMRDVINRRGAAASGPVELNDYLFPIYSHVMTPQERFDARRQFVKDLNNTLSVLADELKLSYKPGAYVLRHSFSNAFIEMGGTTEELQDALNHGSKKTTEVYKHGFSLEKKKKLSEGLFKKPG